MYVIRTYLLPCNHRKACIESKWTIRDRATPRQLRGLRVRYGMANGPEVTTAPFSDQRCIHTSRQHRLLFLTLIVSYSAEKHFRCQNNKYIPVLQEVLLTHEYPDLRMSFNYLTGQNRDNKRALPGTKSPLLLTNSASIDQGLQSQRLHIEIILLEIEALYVTAQFLPSFPRILYNREQKSVYLVAQGKLKVSVLSANFKK